MGLVVADCEVVQPECGGMTDKPTQAEINAAIIAEIYIGVAMARASGLVVGSPRNIRVIPA